MANEPVTDWTSDYDILDSEYVTNPYPVWDDLRQQCPVAHSTRWGGSWMPTRYADVFAVAHDPAHFSSRDVGVLTFSPEDRPPGDLDLPLPPIDADAPMHTWTRRLLGQGSIASRTYRTRSRPKTGLCRKWHRSDSNA